MSAKHTLHVVLVAFSLITGLGLSRELIAAAPEGGTALQTLAAQAVPLKPITREDAELMLREARSAIGKGRLDEAEQILTRVESAHVSFSRFQVGPTPASVRRELTRARQAAQSPAAPSTSRLPFARGSSNAATTVADPFAAQNGSGRQAASTPPTTDAPAKMSRTLGTIAPPEERATPAATSAARPAAADRYPVVQASATENPFKSGSSSSSSRNMTATNIQDPAATAAVSDAPLPAGASRPLAESANVAGLNPPQRMAAPAIAVGSPTQSPKDQAQAKLAEARQALATGDLERAEILAQSANALGVPESDYLPDEDRPSLVAWDIARAKQQGAEKSGSPPTIERLPAPVAARYELPPLLPAGSTTVATAPPANVTPAEHIGAAERNGDEPAALAIPPTSNRVTSVPTTGAESRNSVQASAVATEPPALPAGGTGPQILAGLVPNESSPYRVAAAPALPAAAPPAEELPGPAAPVNAEAPASAAAAPAKTSLIDAADASQQVLARQLSAEIGKRQSEAQRLQEKDPERAIATLHEAEQLVKDSKLPESMQRELLSRIAITLGKAEKYSKDHKSELDLDKQNEAVMAQVDRDREMKVKLQQKIAEMVDEFNRLRDEQRYAEMEIIARRLNELAPDDPVVQQIWQNAKFIRREMMNRQLADDKENSFWQQMHATESAAVNPVAQDGHELAFDQKYWEQFAKNRKGSKERVQRRTERELEIEQRLKTPVLLKYDGTPLSEVMSGLSELTGVNIHLDPRGLSQEGVNSDSPVTINLAKEISLKSALNLILEPLHLSYVIHDEVLKITSEQLRDGEIYPETYNVADLVTPIPNFVPSSNIGLQGLINDSMAAASQGKIGFGGTGPTVLVNDRRSKTGGGANGDVLAQQFNAAPANGISPSTVPIGAGPGGMGGAANADFDSLIDLIVSTVSTDTWAENGGGEAEIRPFPTNLSLVISQTQAVHEEIADLLEQLRRLQDLQVTIEVRFIRLNDRFFERIGIDFDLDIDDSGVNSTNAGQFQPTNPLGHSNTVGLLPPAGTNTFPNFTTDLDIPFRQGSFNAAVPPIFGGFDPNAAANFGFAILSDIEAYFLIEAAQGDTRTNILNAPKVTLFNGQQAFVADTTQRPFVVGVIPVVGEFAAAQQPVIVVLNEGTMMTIQAVVSDDRRYVRMTIVPFFTQIGDVDTFTFEGSSSTTSSSSSTDNDDDGKNESKESSDAMTSSGVTVQLPSFSFVSVVTTVSVPDGGTVLLGGIKRLSEGRNEFGVPLLSKVPYINRLFRNVGIGRETDSLMMMVTPRIIIQEEEEEKLGIAPSGS